MRTSKVLRSVLSAAAALALLAAVAYFFRNQFARNWDDLRHLRLQPYPAQLGLSVAALILSYLLATAMWRLGVNSLAVGRPFSFLQSVGMVNTTQLTKYIPGKIWGYAMQMALVDRRSLSLSAVLYVNIVVALSNSFLAVIAGGCYVTFSSGLAPLPLAAAATIAAALLYLSFLVFNGRFFSVALKIASRLFGRHIERFELPPGILARLQLVSLGSTAAFGLSAVLCAASIGWRLEPRIVWAVSAGFVFADTIGFLAFFVPGGIGVREGLFYAVLAELGAGSLALVLPLAMRVVSMGVDALLGLAGLVTLRRYVKEGAS